MAWRPGTNKKSPERDEPWQFWIDVGGTFTDCIARSPQGELSTCKVLSTGSFTGRVERCDGASLVDTSRDEPDGFFVGYELTLIDEEGAESAPVSVNGFDADSSELTLAGPPVDVSPTPGMRYTLRCDDEAPIIGIRRLLGLRRDEPIPPCRVRLGTTRGTNALLERRGAKVGVVTTAGLGDFLEIGDQTRPDLFALNIQKPTPLHHCVIEVDERIDAAGDVLRPLSEDDATKALQTLRQRGAESLAICLVNAYANAEHELLIERVAHDMGFEQVSTSSQLSPTIHLLDRGRTAVIDAYLSPVVRDYITAVRAGLGDESDLKVMASSGGLVEAEALAGKDSILSGPAGGVVGFAHAARRAEFQKAIGFDMGGTSTDVSRFAGEYEYDYTGEHAGVRVVAPMYAIQTVAAGGGSICDFDGQRLTVGPASAGADPGPACYGRGGPLTVTDINLFNSKLDARHFPFPLDGDAVEKRLADMSQRIADATGDRLTAHELAHGFTQVANEIMSNAIKRVSSARGVDPADHALVSFGGAGAQHACAIAESLGIKTVLLHPMAGILSALGMGVADLRRFAAKSVLRPLDDETLAALGNRFRALERRLSAELNDAGVDDEDIELVRRLDLRYAGQESFLTIRETADHSANEYKDAFENEHTHLFGHTLPDHPVEIATMRVEAIGRTTTPPDEPAELAKDDSEATGQTTTCFDGEPTPTPIYERQSLQPGQRIVGPAMIPEPFSTIVVDPGWSAQVTQLDDIVLTRDEPVESENDDEAKPDSSEVSTSPLNEPIHRDPVRLELYNNRFTHIATQMGQTLRRTAMSVNVKDRLDFSCAILDAQGRLVVNAPHIPVHLGAMGDTVKALIEHVDDLRPGDAYACNDPTLGGSHLPDVTVMSPVFDEDGGSLRFFVASRAHHAEIGGVQPGSTYPFAKSLAEEGVVLRNLRIAREGRFDEDGLREALSGGPHPSRCPQENIADIRAAIAANHQGIVELERLIEQESWQVVSAYMGHIRDAAEEKARAAIAALPDGEHRFADQLDDGSPIVVTMTVRGDAMTVDFTGSADVHAMSLNANRAIVRSAVLYCLRCLIDQPIPLNDGVLAPVELIIPPSLLNPPAHNDPAQQAAVVGGNVEVSQRVVDVLLGALGVTAASQGSMNNFVFGNDTLGYYETICGGAGATASADGASAVHTHMTNTRMTDVEILEQRYPVRVERFAVRRGSGGGAWHGGRRGGDGVIRAIRFLEPMDVSLLTQRRGVAPFGLNGGAPGLRGMNVLRKADGDEAQTLDALAQVRVEPDDVIEIHTPGGGAFGGETERS